MRILIREQGRDGVWKERAAETTKVTIGRSTHAQVQLPGLMVALDHAEIALAGRGEYRLTVKALIGVEYKGRSGVREAVVAVGEAFAIGGHVLRLERPRDGYELILAVELADTDRKVVRPKARLDLAAGGLARRKPALILAGLVLLLALVIPLALIAMNRPAAARAVLPTDASWAAGPVTPAHAAFGHDCQSCHDAAFRTIKDESCTSCHGAIKHHADHPAIAGLEGFAGVGCADCHQEHRGKEALLASNPALCTQCHANPERVAGFEQMAPVKDFLRGHPGFRYTTGTLARDGTRIEAVRSAVAQAPSAPPPRDDSGLLFPHAPHVAAAGIAGPSGRSEVLECSSCHVADAGKASFREVDFEPHCQRCHSLTLNTAERQLTLPHAEAEATRLIVDAYYLPAVRAQAARDADELAKARAAGLVRQRVGGGGPDLGTAAPTPLPDDRALVSAVFEYQVCGKCHLVNAATTPGATPRIVPPRKHHSWLPKAKFDHAPHSAVACADCHGGVAVSTQASDLNLPAIATCRECHVGTEDDHGVQSTCIACHGMHEAEQLLMSPVDGTGQRKAGAGSERSALLLPKDEAHAAVRGAGATTGEALRDPFNAAAEAVVAPVVGVNAAPAATPAATPNTASAAAPRAAIPAASPTTRAAPAIADGRTRIGSNAPAAADAVAAGATTLPPPQTIVGGRARVGTTPSAAPATTTPPPEARP